MQDILQDGPDEGTPMDLTDLVAPQPKTTNTPIGTARNRAATGAFLAGEPDKLVEKYRLMLQEEADGQPVTYEDVVKQINKDDKEKTMGHAIKLLGDNTIPLEQRKRIMSVVQQHSFKEEPAITLQTRSLMAPAAGEDLRGEAARISLSDTMNEINKEAQERQKLMNGFMLDQPDPSATTVKEMAATEVMPFGRNIIGANVAQKVNSTGMLQWIKDFVAPGSTKAQVQERLMNVPPAQRGAYTAKILADIKESASILPSENHYAQYQMAVRLLDEPTHSNGEIWTENMMTILDAFWVGSEAKTLGKALSGTRTASTAAQAAAGNPALTEAGKRFSAAPRDALDEVIARQTALEAPTKEAAQTQKKIKQLQAERDQLLGDASNLAEKGAIAKMTEEVKALEAKRSIFAKEDVKALQEQGMKYKQAEKTALARIADANADIDAQIARINQQIESNRVAAQATAKIDMLDRQLKALQEGYVPSPGLKTPLAEAMDNLRLNSIVRRENPLSPYALVEQTNPEMARSLHQSILASESDEVAQALTGVTREQALINNTYPQISTGSGNVLNKVNQDIQAAVSNTGATRYTQSELQSAVDTISRDFRNATGLEVNDAMTTIRVEGDKLLVDAHYSPVGGPFTSPEAARAQAEFALRDYGVMGDEIVVMKRSGMEYVPVTGGEGAGDYIVKVKSKQQISEPNVESWNPLDVKRNWADRISWLGADNKGSLANWLMDPASMLHPTLTGSASIAADQSVTLENILLKPIKEFRNTVDRLPKDRRLMIEDYIKEANLMGLKHDPLDLIARGFKPNEIDSLKKWRDIWDTHYYLENFDMVRTLNSQGYQIFDNGATKLFGKPVTKNQNIGKVYDPQTNSIRTLSQQEMDDLYNTGGSYVKLRRPLNFQGNDLEHMMVRNTPTEFMRKVKDTDAVLNYREGYYTVGYKKGSKFVDEITIDSSGKETRRTVAVAGNTQDARTFADSQQASTGNKHVVREDSRGFTKDGDGYWDVNDAAGRIAQRLRGQPLTEATGVNTLGNGSFIQDPMESAHRAAKSLAGRTTARPMIETAKKRFIEQYGDMLQKENGMVKFPSSRNEIVDHVSHTSSRVADARTTYGYIKYLEDGYINTADQVFKAGMNTLADQFGKVGMSKAENIAQAVGDISLTNKFKGTVFQAYIVASNPIRQWIVQSHQATRMMAYNPIGVANGGMVSRFVSYVGDTSGLRSSTNNAFTKFVEDSGMVAGVDRNSLVRGLGLSMADSSSKVKRAAGNVLSLPQTLGFDVGEKANQLMHLAAVHEKYTRAGKNLLDPTIRDLALTEARALSYDLNKAGELAYTQSSAATILQFLQMPHKAVLQLTNRKLATADAIKMATWDMVMWGAGAGATYSIISDIVTSVSGDDRGILPDNPDLREKFVYGMESYYLNKFFTQLDDSGQETRIDFSSLQPNDMDGWARMWHTMMNDGPLAALAASPTGQLLAVDGVGANRRNGRIPKAIITLGRYFNVFEELDPENPTEFTAVLNDAAKISSGWTAAQNAMMMLETRKKLNAAGSVVSDQVTIPEVWAAALGFGLKSDKELYLVTKNLQDNAKDHQKDLMKRYRDIVGYYTEQTKGPNTNIDHIQKVASMLMRTFDNPQDLAFVAKQWKLDMAGKEANLTRALMKAADIPDSKEYEDNIRLAPIDEDQKRILIQRHRDVQALQNQNKQGKGN